MPVQLAARRQAVRAGKGGAQGGARLARGPGAEDGLHGVAKQPALGQARAVVAGQGRRAADDAETVEIVAQGEGNDGLDQRLRGQRRQRACGNVAGRNIGVVHG